MKQFIEPREHRVLLIDGSDEHRDAAAPALDRRRRRRGSVQLTSVGTAADALAAVRADGAQPFDLVVTGLELPDKRGFDLIDELAEEPALRDVPVIVYSPRSCRRRRRRTSSGSARRWSSRTSARPSG